jgi:hypothetical protein
MATTEHLPPVPGLPGDGDEQNEREIARKLAERYRFAFIDLRTIRDGNCFILSCGSDR